MLRLSRLAYRYVMHVQRRNNVDDIALSNHNNITIFLKEIDSALSINIVVILEKYKYLFIVCRYFLGHSNINKLTYYTWLVITTGYTLSFGKEVLTYRRISIGISSYPSLTVFYVVWKTLGCYNNYYNTHGTKRMVTLSIFNPSPDGLTLRNIILNAQCQIVYYCRVPRLLYFNICLLSLGPSIK